MYTVVKNSGYGDIVIGRTANSVYALEMAKKVLESNYLGTSWVETDDGEVVGQYEIQIDAPGYYRVVRVD